MNVSELFNQHTEIFVIGFLAIILIGQYLWNKGVFKKKKKEPVQQYEHNISYSKYHTLEGQKKALISELTRLNTQIQNYTEQLQNADRVYTQKFNELKNKHKEVVAQTEEELELAKQRFDGKQKMLESLSDMMKLEKQLEEVETQ